MLLILINYEIIFVGASSHASSTASSPASSTASSPASSFLLLLGLGGGLRGIFLFTIIHNNKKIIIKEKTNKQTKDKLTFHKSIYPIQRSETFH